MEISKENYIRDILNNLRKIDYIKLEDIPNIDLYMDQVTTFMDEHLKYSRRYSEDKLLTKTMINNYTKNDLLPSPHKKKYSKEHMLLLIFIYYFKSFLSINDIQSILHPITEEYFENEGSISMEDLYREIFQMEKEQIDDTAQDILRLLENSKDTFPEVEDEEKRDSLTDFSFICMLGFDVYVKKQMIERLIDRMNEKNVSNEKGTAKEKSATKEKKEKES